MIKEEKKKKNKGYGKVTGIVIIMTRKLFKVFINRISSVQFSCSVMSDSLWPHGLQHARSPCPSPTPGVYSNSCPLSQWCHPTIYLIICHPLLLLPSVFPSIRVFSYESVRCIRRPKYWSFSFNISPFSEYSGLISFRTGRFDLLAVQGTPQESFPAPHFENISFLALSLLYGPTLALEEWFLFIVPRIHFLNNTLIF